MNYYRYSFNIKIGLFLFGLIIILVLFWLNWYLVEEIRGDARKQVEHLAVTYSEAISRSEGNAIQYVLEYVMPTINFPIIITSADEIYAFKNLNLELVDDEVERKERIQRLAKRMDVLFEPLSVPLVADRVMQIHYGDPAIIKQLRWLPYMELGGVFLFILVGFMGFQLVRRSEKNFIWAGLAREAAHQLGTPISSMLGWTKLLEDDHEDREAILTGMAQDLERLKAISERFHKIGANPLLSELDITQLARDSVIYMRTRIPARSKIQLNLVGEPLTIRGEPVLLTWALENLIKNALDAMRGYEGQIQVVISSENKRVIIDVQDNGSGISRTDRRNIFKPGFSTKTRGWGLGLSLTQRIIEVTHHGKIRLLRSRPGETVFRISLPLN